MAACIMYFSNIYASEPGNNLNKSLYTIQQEFPDCIFWCESGRGKYYKTMDDAFQLCLKSKIIKLSPSLCLLRDLEVSPKIGT